MFIKIGDREFELMQWKKLILSLYGSVIEH